MDNVKFARNKELTEALKQKYIDLLLEHHEAISNSLFDTGRSQTIAHNIQLKKQDPIYMKQFRIPDAQLEAVQNHVEELLKLGVVRPSRSKFNNPIYLVSRFDGGLRIVHDFRAINQETLLEPYSMKNLQDSMEDLSRAGSKLFSKIDLTSGFWQMFLNPEVHGVHITWNRSIRMERVASQTNWSNRIFPETNGNCHPPAQERTGSH